MTAFCSITSRAHTTKDGGRGGKESKTHIDGKALDPFRGKRANKGQFIESKIKPTGLV